MFSFHQRTIRVIRVITATGIAMMTHEELAGSEFNTQQRDHRMAEGRRAEGPRLLNRSLHVFMYNRASNPGFFSALCHSSHGFHSVSHYYEKPVWNLRVFFFFFFLPRFPSFAHIPQIRSRERIETFESVPFRRPRDSCRKRRFPQTLTGEGLTRCALRLNDSHYPLRDRTARLARYNSCRDRGICMRRPLNGARMTDSRDDENAAERVISAMR